MHSKEVQTSGNNRNQRDDAPGTIAPGSSRLPHTRSSCKPVAMDAGKFLLPIRARTAAPALVCMAGFAVLAWWALSGGSMAFDEAGLALWREGAEGSPRGPDWLLPAMRGISFLGSAPVRDAVAAAAILGLLVTRNWREAALLVLTVLGAALLNSWMKLQFVRARPEIVPWLGDASGFSFPSGHAFNSAAVYLAAALAIRGLAAGGRGSAFTNVLVVASVCLAGGIAFSRVWLGVHYPTDALAGWLGGTGWVLALRVLAAARPPARD